MVNKATIVIGFLLLIVGSAFAVTNMFDDANYNNRFTLHNVSNISTANLTVWKNLTASGNITFSRYLSCTLKTDIGGNLLCGVDNTGGGGGGTNGTGLTDVIQSIALGGGPRTWGNISFGNSSTINWTTTSGLQNVVVSAEYRNESLSNLDTRQRLDNNTFGMRYINPTYPIQGGGNLVANVSLTFDNTSYANLDTRERLDNISNNARMDLLYAVKASNTTSIGTTFPLAGGGTLAADRTLTFDNTSYANLDQRQRVDNSTLTALINQFTKAVNGIIGNITIRGTSMINVTGNSTDIVISYNNQSLENLDARERQNNVSLTNYINLFVKAVNGVLGNATIRGTSMINVSGNSTDIVISFNNQSLENLDTRQKADNASIIRTDRNGAITGGLNVTTYINSTNVWASQINGSIDCKYITGAPDTDFCTDAGAAGTVTSVNAQTGDVLLQGSAHINVTGNSSSAIKLSLNNQSFENLDTRERQNNISLVNYINTFVKALNGVLGNATIRGTSMINVSGNSTDVVLSFNNQSLENLDTRERQNNISLVNYINLFVKAVNGVLGNATIRGTSMINVSGNSTDIVISYNNQSLENLDIRQRADNASIARLNAPNTFTTNQFIQGNLNVTGLINATKAEVHVNLSVRAPPGGGNNSGIRIWNDDGSCAGSLVGNGTGLVMKPGVC